MVDDGVPFSRWEKASGLKERTFALAVKALTAAGRVAKAGKGRAGRYRLAVPTPDDSDAPPF
jgi:hypothetical protein